MMWAHTVHQRAHSCPVSPFSCLSSVLVAFLVTVTKLLTKKKEKSEGREGRVEFGLKHLREHSP